MGARTTIAAAVAGAAAAVALTVALPATGAAPPVKPQLLLIPTGSDAAAALRSTAARRIAGYQTFDLVEASGADAARLRRGGAVVRDDMREVRLGGASIDPTREGAQLSGKGSRAAPRGPRLLVVQFVGPIKDAWRARLEATGAQIVTYMAENAYLVHASAEAAARVAALRDDATVRAVVPFPDAAKLRPGLPASGTHAVVIQTVAGAAGSDARARGRRLGAATRAATTVGAFRTERRRVDTAQLAALTADPGVVNVAPDVQPELHDERTAQIVAGNLSGTFAPTGPGYLAHLGAEGFPTTLSDFVVDITDEGLDTGIIPADGSGPEHPDFFTGGDEGEATRIAYINNRTTDTGANQGRDCGGHGTNVASIATGFNDGTGSDNEDAAGFNYGLGVAPRMRLGASKIFTCAGGFSAPAGFTALASAAYAGGARVSNNSWGAGVYGIYTSDAQEYDAIVRDARPGGGNPGNQQLVELFSAGNDGTDFAGRPLDTIGSPGTAKNVITVGAAESVRATPTSCGDASSARDVINFSSRGPTDDGRLKPDVVSPGTRVSGAAPQHGAYNGSGTCIQNFIGSKYSLVSGTSQAAPNATGLAALVRDWFTRTQGGEPPSPAMTKALMTQTAVSLTGGNDGHSGTLGPAPDQHQGWGRVNLAGILDGPAREFRDQVDRITGSGGGFARSYAVDDPGQPVRVALAWTDAPGPTPGANAFVNNLDLRVTASDGTVYAGNQIDRGQSIADPSEADERNNLEHVMLPAGALDGTFTVRVNGTSIGGDGVPGNGDATDQDFALVVSNGTEEPGAAVVRSDGATVRERGDGDGALEAGEGFEVEPRLVNAGTGSSTVSGTLSGPPGTTIHEGSASWGRLSAGESAGPSRTLLGRVPNAVGCPGALPLTLSLSTSGGAVSVPVSLPLGRAGNAASVPAGGRPVPDGVGPNLPGSFAVSTLEMAGDGTVEDLDVTVDLRHTFIGDVEVRLQSPQGTTVTLTNRPGGNNNNGDNMNAVFDDEAAGGIPSPSTGTISGRFRPATPLNAVDGEPVAGTWQLQVRDHFNQDVGTLNGWSTRRPECDAARPATPPAVTVSGPDSVAAGSPATYTASASDSSGITRIDWDTDGDGAFDDGTGGSVSRTFSSPGSRTVRARALDGFLVAGEGSKTTTVTDGGGGGPGGGGTTPPPGGGTTPPPGGDALTITRVTRSARVDRRRRFAFRFTVDQAASGRALFRARLGRRSVRLGRASFLAASARTVRVRVRLSARNLARLRRARRARVIVTITSGSTTERLTFTLRPPRR